MSEPDRARTAASVGLGCAHGGRVAPDPRVSSDPSQWARKQKGALR
jgi:hypothetical protein